MTSGPRVLAARAYRDGTPWWTIEIPELTSTAPNGVEIVATGGAVSTRGIPAAARELAAVHVGIAEVDVRVSVEAPPEVLAIWDEGARAEEAARAALRHAGALRREAVRTLRADGYTVEAVAAALGISPARVSQLAATPDAGDALADTA
ncbi:hypothetical protein [Rathayibacter sp. VKM Ac-2928]|uniref:hypothetical protein n=1 Tax=Rathayibacter sp. VKM Ac-2928 TaxID=2929479 RepID=UPI001FB3C4FA|nr:hypothetical protein [Rathayibacter sp. VKM Ac-2928]MCJ1681545.1 hypothetical protein [Rathayibacter sp. VKM Ac-2928]